MVTVLAAAVPVILARNPGSQVEFSSNKPASRGKSFPLLFPGQTYEENYSQPSSRAYENGKSCRNFFFKSANPSSIN